MPTTAILTHKVSSFSSWKQAFEAGAEMREQAGVKIHGVYQSTEDENNVTIISEFADLATAKAIFTDSAMKETMEKSGVVSEPEVKFLSHAF